MDENQKRGFVSLISGIGTIIFFAGIFVEGIEFWFAFLIAMTCWILSGSIATFLGVKDTDKKKRKNQPYSLDYSNNSSRVEDFELEGPAKKFCSSCGSSNSLESIFCETCGKKL